MIFKNKELQTKYDMATTKQDTNGKYSIKDVCGKLCDVQYEIARLCEDGDREIQLDDKYQPLVVDMEKMYQISGQQTAETMARKIRRNTKESQGLERKILDIFGISIKEIDKKNEELQWSKSEIDNFKKQYLKILYLFGVMENILFPSKKVVEIFKYPDMDFMDSDNTDWGIILRIITNEVQKECESCYITEIEEQIALIYDFFSNLQMHVQEKNILKKDKMLIDSLRLKCKEIEERLSTTSNSEKVYEKNLFHWFYLQMRLYEERCKVKGYLRAYQYQLKERHVEEKYRLTDSLCKESIRVPYEEYINCMGWYSYCYQKPLDDIKETEQEKIIHLMPKIATYINIINKQSGGVYDRRSITIGEWIAIVQEILCAENDNDIKYDYYGYHNSDTISVKRSLEKGHNQPLYIIQELVLFRKFIRGKCLINSVLGESAFELVDILGYLIELMLFDIFLEKRIEDMQEKIQSYDEFLRSKII